VGSREGGAGRQSGIPTREALAERDQARTEWSAVVKQVNDAEVKVRLAYMAVQSAKRDLEGHPDEAIFRGFMRQAEDDYTAHRARWDQLDEERKRLSEIAWKR
jgi:hypothetical protein